MRRTGQHTSPFSRLGPVRQEEVVLQSALLGLVTSQRPTRARAVAQAPRISALCTMRRSCRLLALLACALLLQAVVCKAEDGVSKVRAKGFQPQEPRAKD